MERLKMLFAQKRERNTALDLLRISALFCVISVHFFYNLSIYYYSPVVGLPMLVMTAMRGLFMICVPLFMMLSGFLMRNKKLSGRYYLGLIKTYAVYLIASVACTYYKIHVLGQNVGYIDGIINFNGAQYAWYVEMYIGLFLLIPFLNVMYNGLDGKGKKLVLIATMLFFTSLGQIINDLPTWNYTVIYPITYYFIGCYLNEYPPRLKWYVTLPALVAAIAALGGVSFWLCYGQEKINAPWQSHQSLPIVIISVLWFVLFMNINCSRFPSWLRYVIGVLSNLTFGAYLMSYIADKMVYGSLVSSLKAVGDYVRADNMLGFYFPCVFKVLVLSFVFSAGCNIVYSLIRFLITTVISRCKTKRTV